MDFHIKQEAKAFEKKGRTPEEIIALILEKRGHRSEDDIKNFFSWELTDLGLGTLLDLEKTAQRIILALNEKQKIGIYGDYDVDGTTSCALFFQFFKLVGIEVELIQPSRFEEGYGLHLSSIDDAISRGIQLLITVDCGITNNQAAEYALDRQLDLIITDHHKDGSSEMPKAYSIVNPNRRDEPKDSALKSLAGVGVAFAICIKVRELLIQSGQKIDSLYPLLQYVAIGTISDLANLNEVNRPLVRHGLKQLPQSLFPGLKVFLDKNDRNKDVLPSEKVSFFIGPLINSKGRLDHPELALKLLIEEDMERAFEYFEQLKACNQERKLIQAEVFAGAKEQAIKKIDSPDTHCLIVYQKEWHEGVIGIVASKLVESFRVPAIVFTDSEDSNVIKASCRSAGELNLYELLASCSDLFLKFGGHKAAAGLSMPKENLEEFTKRMNGLLSNIPAIERTEPWEFDLEISLDEITPKLIKSLEKLEPFGMGNRQPIFRIRNFKIDHFKYLKDKHVKWTLKTIDQKQTINGISFFFTEKWDQAPAESLFHEDPEGLGALATLGFNHWNGNIFMQLMISRIEADLFAF